MVEHLPGMHKVPGSISSTAREVLGWGFVTETAWLSSLRWPRDSLPQAPKCSGDRNVPSCPAKADVNSMRKGKVKKKISVIGWFGVKERKMIQKFAH